jgi:hypothetical protein
MLPVLIKFKFKFKSSFRSTFDRARLTVLFLSCLEQNDSTLAAARARALHVAQVHEVREDRGRPSERRFKEAQSAMSCLKVWSKS